MLHINALGSVRCISTSHNRTSTIHNHWWNHLVIWCCFTGIAKCLQIRLIFHKSEKPPFWPILPRNSSFGNSPHFPILFKNRLFHPVLQTFKIMMSNLRHTTLQRDSQSQTQHSQYRLIPIVNFTNTTNYRQFDLTSNSHFGITGLSRFTLWISQTLPIISNST